MVLDGAAVDVLELADQHLGVAALVAAKLGVEGADAGAHALGPQQPVALLLGRAAGVAGLGGRHRGVGVVDEGVAEPLLPGGEKFPGNRGFHDILPFFGREKENISIFRINVKDFRTKKEHASPPFFGAHVWHKHFGFFP